MLKIGNPISGPDNIEEGTAILEGASNQKIDIAKTKDLISASKGQNAHFNVTITKSSAPNLRYWDSVNNNVIKIFYKGMTAQAPNAKFDTLRTVETIDGLNFKNFQMHVKVNEETTLHNFYITRLYNGYTTVINYYYADKFTGEELKQMLKESKFETTLIKPNR